MATFSAAGFGGSFVRDWSLDLPAACEHGAGLCCEVDGSTLCAECFRGCEGVEQCPGLFMGLLKLASPVPVGHKFLIGWYRAAKVTGRYNFLELLQHPAFAQLRVVDARLAIEEASVFFSTDHASAKRFPGARFALTPVYASAWVASPAANSLVVTVDQEQDGFCWLKLLPPDRREAGLRLYYNHYREQRTGWLSKTGLRLWLGDLGLGINADSGALKFHIMRSSPQRAWHITTRSCKLKSYYVCDISEADWSCLPSGNYGGYNPPGDGACGYRCLAYMNGATAVSAGCSSDLWCDDELAYRVFQLSPTFTVTIPGGRVCPNARYVMICDKQHWRVKRAKGVGLCLDENCFRGTCDCQRRSGPPPAPVSASVLDHILEAATFGNVRVATTEETQRPIPAPRTQPSPTPPKDVGKEPVVTPPVPKPRTKFTKPSPAQVPTPAPRTRPQSAPAQETSANAAAAPGTAPKWRVTKTVYDAAERFQTELVHRARFVGDTLVQALPLKAPAVQRYSMTLKMMRSRFSWHCDTWHPLAVIACLLPIWPSLALLVSLAIGLVPSIGNNVVLVALLVSSANYVASMDHQCEGAACLSLLEEEHYYRAVRWRPITGALSLLLNLLGQVGYVARSTFDAAYVPCTVFDLCSFAILYLCRNRCWRCFGRCVRVGPATHVLGSTGQRVSKLALIDLCDHFSKPATDIVGMATGWSGCYTGTAPMERQCATTVDPHSFDQKKAGAIVYLTPPVNSGSALQCLNVMWKRPIGSTVLGEQTGAVVTAVKSISFPPPCCVSTTLPTRPGVTVVDHALYNRLTASGVDPALLRVGQGDFLKLNPGFRLIGGWIYGVCYFVLVTLSTFTCLPIKCGIGTRDPFCRRVFSVPVIKTQEHCHAGMCASAEGISLDSLGLTQLQSYWIAAVTCGLVVLLVCHRLAISALDLLTLASPLVLLVFPWAAVGLLLACSLAGATVKIQLLATLFINLFFPQATLVTMGYWACVAALAVYSLMGLRVKVNVPMCVTPAHFLLLARSAGQTREQMLRVSAAAPANSLLGVARDCYVTGSTRLYIPKEGGMVFEGLFRSPKARGNVGFVAGSSYGTGSVWSRNNEVVVLTASHVVGRADMATLKIGDTMLTLTFKKNGDFAEAVTTQAELPGNWPPLTFAQPTTGPASWCTATGDEEGLLSGEVCLAWTTSGDSGSAVVQGDAVVGVHTGSNTSGVAYVTTPGGKLLGADTVTLSSLSKHFTGPLTRIPKDIPDNIIADVDAVPRSLAMLIDGLSNRESSLSGPQLLLIACFMWSYLNQPTFLPYVLGFFAANFFLPKSIGRPVVTGLLWLCCLFTPLSMRLCLFHLVCATVTGNVVSLWFYITAAGTSYLSEMWFGGYPTMLFVPRFLVYQFPGWAIGIVLAVCSITMLAAALGHTLLLDVFSASGRFDRTFMMKYFLEGGVKESVTASVTRAYGKPITQESLTATLAALTDDDFQFLSDVLDCRVVRSAMNLRAALTSFQVAQYRNILNASLQVDRDAARSRRLMAKLADFAVEQEVSAGDRVVVIDGLDRMAHFKDDLVLVPLTTKVVGGSRCTICDVVKEEANDTPAKPVPSRRRRKGLPKGAQLEWDRHQEEKRSAGDDDFAVSNDYVKRVPKYWDPNDTRGTTVKIAGTTYQKVVDYSGNVHYVEHQEDLVDYVLGKGSYECLDQDKVLDLTNMLKVDPTELSAKDKAKARQLAHLLLDLANPVEAVNQLNLRAPHIFPGDVGRRTFADSKDKGFVALHSRTMFLAARDFLFNIKFVCDDEFTKTPKDTLLGYVRACPGYWFIFRRTHRSLIDAYWDSMECVYALPTISDYDVSPGDVAVTGERWDFESPGGGRAKRLTADLVHAFQGFHGASYAYDDKVAAAVKGDPYRSDGVLYNTRWGNIPYSVPTNALEATACYRAGCEAVTDGTNVVATIGPFPEQQPIPDIPKSVLDNCADISCDAFIAPAAEAALCSDLEKYNLSTQGFVLPSVFSMVRAYLKEEIGDAPPLYLPSTVPSKNSQAGINGAEFPTKSLQSYCLIDDMVSKSMNSNLQTATMATCKRQYCSKYKIRSILGTNNYIGLGLRACLSGVTAAFQKAGKDGSPIYLGKSKFDPIPSPDKYCLETDLESCDRSTPALVRWFATNLIFELAGQPELVHSYVLNCCHDLVVAGSVAFTKRGGLSSGDPITSISNTIYSLVLYTQHMLLCGLEGYFPEIAEKYLDGSLGLRDMFKYVRVYIYSDDVVLTTPNQHYAASFDRWVPHLQALLGFKVDPKKTVNTSAPSFLGCRFKQVGDKCYLASLQDRVTRSLLYHIGAKNPSEYYEAAVSIFKDSIICCDEDWWVDLYRRISDAARTDGVEFPTIETLTSFRTKQYESAVCTVCGAAPVAKSACGGWFCGNCVPYHVGHCHTTSLFANCGHDIMYRATYCTMCEGSPKQMVPKVPHPILDHLLCHIDYGSKEELTLVVADGRTSSPPGRYKVGHKVVAVVADVGGNIVFGCGPGSHTAVPLQDTLKGVVVNKALKNAAASEYVEGPPGSGKTFHLVKDVLAVVGSATLVVPTHASMLDCINKLKQAGADPYFVVPKYTVLDFPRPGSGNITVRLPQVGTSEGETFVDEVAYFSPVDLARILTQGRVKGYGDLNQLGCVGPASVPRDLWLRHFASLEPLRVCHRFGAAVCDLIKGIYPYYEPAPHTTKVVFVPNPDFEKGVVITAYHKDRGLGHRTIDSIQGCTFPVVTLRLPTPQSLTRPRAVVAVTRASRELYIYDPFDQLSGLLKFTKEAEAQDLIHGPPTASHLGQEIDLWSNEGLEYYKEVNLLYTHVPIKDGVIHSYPNCGPACGWEKQSSKISCLPRVAQNLGYHYSPDLPGFCPIPKELAEHWPVVSNDKYPNCLQITLQRVCELSKPCSAGYMVGQSVFTQTPGVTSYWLTEWVDGKARALPDSLFSSGRFETNCRAFLDEAEEKFAAAHPHACLGEITKSTVGGSHFIFSQYLPPLLPASAVALVGASLAGKAAKAACSVVDVYAPSFEPYLHPETLSRVYKIMIDFKPCRLMVWRDATFYVQEGVDAVTSALAAVSKLIKVPANEPVSFHIASGYRTNALVAPQAKISIGAYAAEWALSTEPPPAGYAIVRRYIVKRLLSSTEVFLCRRGVVSSTSVQTICALEGCKPLFNFLQIGSTIGPV
uniref:Replicase polyprotein 1ab n=12 Tax=Equine arteritis virus TaxID=11047 RepID=G9FTQ9_EAV|nr:replicase polyprotein 1ab [Equine arteritis virus]